MCAVSWDDFQLKLRAKQRYSSFTAKRAYQTNLRKFYIKKLMWVITNKYCSFYHGYCNYQRDALVIILRYTMVHHKVIHTSPFGTMWKTLCVWNSKSCQLHEDFTFLELTLFISYLHVRYHFLCEVLLFQINLPLL